MDHGDIRAARRVAAAFWRALADDDEGLLRAALDPAGWATVQAAPGALTQTVRDLLDVQPAEAARVATTDMARVVDDDAVMFTCMYLPLGDADLVEGPTEFSPQRGADRRGWRLFVIRRPEGWRLFGIGEPPNVQVREYVSVPFDEDEMPEGPHLA